MAIPAAERKAVLDLFPYFNQKYPIVFDVGSNKGDFSEVFVNNVAEIHLFEPNELLLHYSMVRFCDKQNISYSNQAVYSKTSIENNKHIDRIPFYYFTNENNGLSSIIDNPKWDSLPKKKKMITYVSLDDYAKNNIDLIKIDVEGGEMEVLKGAKNILSKRSSIKFIQVEKADHIELTGYKFDDIVYYLSTFGYSPIQTQDKENVIFAMQGFTQNWNQEFIKNTKDIKVDFALEIGCFEGLTSRYICDNLLNYGGRMICVDPLTDEYLPGHPDNEMFIGQYDRFTRNTKGYPIELIRKKSNEVFNQLQDYRFGFIYVDGDHTEEAVYQDAYLAFNLCLPGGKILFDDYEGYREETTRGIDRFLKELPINKMTYQKLGYQVMCTKHENLD